MAPSPLSFLHLEASTGWGGQEIRTLREAIGMREKGHRVIFAVQPGATLGERAQKEGFSVFFIDFRRRVAFKSLFQLIALIRREKIDIIVSHSSKDGWLGGFAGKIARRTVVRTRHLSTAIKGGLNAYLLYRFLADKVVTTCEEVAASLRTQAGLSKERCQSIPTGVNPLEIEKGLLASPFPKPSPFVVGTACVLRSWKGLQTMVEALSLLKDHPDISLLIVGDGPMRPKLELQATNLGIRERVHFTGHLENPFPAIAAMDLFLLLSTAHEGVSQASLQAAYLGKPLIATPTGGLKEVAIDHHTGALVPLNAPQAVASAILALKQDPNRLQSFSKAIKTHLTNHFLWDHTLSKLLAFYTAP